MAILFCHRKEQRRIMIMLNSIRESWSNDSKLYEKIFSTQTFWLVTWSGWWTSSRWWTSCTTRGWPGSLRSTTTRTAWPSSPSWPPEENFSTSSPSRSTSPRSKLQGSSHRWLPSCHLNGWHDVWSNDILSNDVTDVISKIFIPSTEDNLINTLPLQFITLRS